MAPGERGREQSMRIALSHDTRFEPLAISSDIPVDLQFAIDNFISVEIMDKPSHINIPKRLNMELKRPEDFVQSVLNGHLYDQALSIRESGYNGCTVILGTLDEIYVAIDESNEKRIIDLPGGKKKFKFLNQDDRSNANASTLLRLKSFKKRSTLNGVPIFWKGDDSGFFDGEDQWEDILNLAHDYLCDGDMLGFRMRPAENEREVVAASMCFKGIGSESMRELLKEYTLCFCPRGAYAKPIEELPGWGKKRCDTVNPMVRMIYR